MAYNGPSRVNMVEYISTLNHVPDQEVQPNSEFLEDDLAMFTNANFFDFDLGQDADLQPTDYNGEGRREQAAAPDAVDMKSLEFMNGDFHFPDFNSFPPTTFTDTSIPPAKITTTQPIYTSSSNAGSPPQSANPSSGTKRKAESISHAGSPSASVEDAARNAAEEDKRRRNTAASARFRVKKKQREQALERSAKDMSDKVAALEGRINQLETENKWLKNLITERNESKEDIAGLWKRYNAENAERKGSERKDGVGTSA